MEKIKICLSLIICCTIFSCQHYQLKKDYKYKHDKYRTLWYRTDQNCFYDSTRKYGLLYDSIIGLSESDTYKIDTITVNESGICK